MDTIERIDQGYAWTAARIAVVTVDDLDATTPCSRWDLRELLDHTIGALTMLIDAVDPDPVGPGPAAAPTDGPEVRALGPSEWDRSIAELAGRARRAWQAPGVMDRTVELPIGNVPASVAASATLLEVVVHGWDISQASGERAEIPDALARPVLEFARQAIDDVTRGDNFAADLGFGDSASDRLVAFLGRKSL